LSYPFLSSFGDVLETGDEAAYPPTHVADSTAERRCSGTRGPQRAPRSSGNFGDAEELD
jgi:hypothetical protein